VIAGHDAARRAGIRSESRGLLEQQNLFREDFMIFAKAFSIAAVGLALGITAVVAQQDPIAARKALMKANVQNAGAMVKMTKGETPFDAAKVEAAFNQWATTAEKFPALFPDDSKTGGETRASPKIWQAKSDFDAKAAAFGKAVAENREKAVASLDGLKASVPVVGKTCDNCHEDYRLSKQ
jgi:cytochrome c556